MSGGRVRLGVVGAGRWGRNIIRTVATLEGAELAALASTNADAASLVPPECKVTPDWRELLDPGRIDGLILAVPPRAQVEIGEAALRSNLAVFFEKPLALTVEDASRLAEFAREKKAPTLVDHIYLFHPAFALLKERALKWPSIDRITSEGGAFGPFRPGFPPLFDWGPHDVAMCLDLLQQEPADISARRLASKTMAEGTGELVRLDLRFPSGTRARITMGNILERRMRRFAVASGESEIVFDGIGGEMLSCREGGVNRVLAVPPTLPLTEAIRTFADRVRRRDSDTADMDFGCRVVAVLSEAAGQLSHQTAVQS